jgi:raffinose/stachyose/melibiose transport system substrate-binding protein
MRHSPWTRIGVLSLLAALAVGACSGGFGGASPTTAPSVAEPSSPAEGSEPPASQAAEPVTLSWYVDDNNVTAARLNGLIDAYKEIRPEVTIEIETHPGGTEGDNLVKTRLSTGEMNDIFYYNSGSLLQALNPADTLVDLSDEPFIANIQETYLPTVSAGDAIVGVPTEGTLGGGILYNKKIYADNGLQPPKTWAEFASNADKIKAAGIPPVCATYGDTWTSQLFVLADYYNVQVAVPDFCAPWAT